jgi:hypothetical protein
MATTAPAQMNLGGGSAWHHVSATVGGMGAQTAGANGAIAMKGGRRRQSRRQSHSRRQSRRQSHSRKVDRRQSHSRRQGQRGGRR